MCTRCCQLETVMYLTNWTIVHSSHKHYCLRTAGYLTCEYVASIEISIGRSRRGTGLGSMQRRSSAAAMRRQLGHVRHASWLGFGHRIRRFSSCNSAGTYGGATSTNKCNMGRLPANSRNAGSLRLDQLRRCDSRSTDQHQIEPWLETSRPYVNPLSHLF